MWVSECRCYWLGLLRVAFGKVHWGSQGSALHGGGGAGVGSVGNDGRVQWPGDCM